MIHQLKISKKYFDDVQNGKKTFEVRKNDRGYKVGDTLILKEIDDYDLIYPFSRGREINVEITYILNGPIYGLEDGYCVLGVKKCV